MFARHIYPGHRKEFLYPGYERDRLIYNLRKLAAPAVRFGRDFCLETSIHGFNHIAAKRRHWTERVCWMFVMGLAIWFAIDVSLGQYQRFDENPTVVTLDKDFRSWNTSMPGVTVCDKDRIDPRKLPQVMKTLWNISEKDPKYAYYKSFVSSVVHADLLDLTEFLDYKDDETLNVDLYRLVVDPLEMFARHIYPGHRKEFLYPGYERDRLIYNLRKLAAPAVRFGRDFCLETSIHGFNHIAAKRRHWTERVFWMFVMGLAIWFAIDVSLGQYQRFDENPTVVTLDKDFRSWNTSMPGVTVCDKNRIDPHKLPQVMKTLWNISEKDPKYAYYKSFVSSVVHADLLDLTEFLDYKDDETLNVDLYRLVVDVLPAPQVKTTWSVGTITKWTPVMTETGACYTTNSVAVADTAIEQPDENETLIEPVTCKYSKLSCYVIFEITKDADFTFHSPYDIPDITTPAINIYLTLNRQMELSVMETKSGRGIRELQPKRRHCLYNDEPSSKGKEVYSTNNCRQLCRNRLALRFCGCKPFYYEHEEGPSCTTAGMACLSSYSDKLAKIEGISCSCSQQCVDAVFEEISYEDQFWRTGVFANRGAIRFIVQSPRTRYTREIVFHFHDLVVSFGGAAGLFLGASFISFVEILYFLFGRIVGACSIRDKNNVLKKTKLNVPYDARITKLTSILENRKKLEEQRHGTILY